MSRTPTREGYQPNRGKRQGKPPQSGTAVVSRFDRDEVVLRVECPPPPSNDKDTGTPIRDGGFARIPDPNPIIINRDPDGPGPRESRYRLARKGDLYRVEEWRRLWRIGPYGWRAVPYASSDLMNVDTTETDPFTARDRLDRLRAKEHAPTAWQPVDDADLAGGSGEG